MLGAPAGAPHAGIAEAAWSDRRLLLVPREQLSSDGPGFAGQGSALTLWERADVAGGMPQVYPSTSEAFVAQMLNLDLLGAIAFDKGCYTGQEVIARAHYRGRVKRRMQRWRHASATPLAPGDSARAADGRTLTVVRVAPGGVDGYELLAVGNFAAPAARNNRSVIRGRRARRAVAAALFPARVKEWVQPPFFVIGARTTPRPAHIRRRAPA